LGVALCGVFALYNMMYMFLSSMLWAFLVGTVLFPFKKKVTDTVQSWLRGLQKSNQTLAKAVVTLPFTIFKNISETIYNTFFSTKGAIIIAAYIALKILSYERTFMYIISWMGRIYGYLDSFIVFFARPWVLPLIIVYFCCYAAWIYVQEPKQINKKLARTFSLPIWFVFFFWFYLLRIFTSYSPSRIYVISYASLYFGPLRACIFGLSAAVLALLSAGIIGSSHRHSEVKNEKNSTENDENSSENSEELAPKTEEVLVTAKQKCISLYLIRCNVRIFSGRL
uniref:Uncharacterized protein n=1 Tax=Caenorhabditis japonica TaxID=281687 RepID=A0A8R1EFQ2_CAEJA